MSADYQPYGVEWEAEMMKWRKRDIIGLLRQACTKEGTNLHANNKTIIPVCPHYSREMVKSTEYVEFDICTCMGNPGKQESAPGREE
jgi:hypothetical protein